MSPISQRFAIPTNDDEFEHLCRELLRHHWSRPGLEIFGKRGERQFGIDILDLSGQTPICAAQCKLKEEHKNLTPSEIEAEVNEAKKFTPPLGKYAILTTAKISTHAQRKLREINQSHKQQSLFEVELLTWDRLCSLLQQYSEVQEKFYGSIPFERAIRMEANLLAIQGGVESLTVRADGDSIDSQINEARDCITKREFQLATLLLNRIQRNHEGKLGARQRFRVTSNLGAAALGLGKAEAAAKLFFQAAPLRPNDEQAKINEVFAYLLVGDLVACHTKAAELRREYPGAARLAFLWLASAPNEIPSSVLESEINTILRTDPEVALALARRALTEFDFEKGYPIRSRRCQGGARMVSAPIGISPDQPGKGTSYADGLPAKAGTTRTIAAGGRTTLFASPGFRHRGKRRSNPSPGPRVARRYSASAQENR